MNKYYDICIIGGGAAGMAAAVSAAQEAFELAKNGAAKPLDIVIFEKKEALGKKVSATGNGRCNITNARATDMHEVQDFFENVGVFMRTEEEGRMYPYSGRASHVVKAFENKLESLGVEVLYNTTVTSVIKNDDIFSVSIEGGRVFEAGKLIIACGGKAAPQYGTTGDGYAWARALGHSVSRLAPALAPIELDACDYGGKDTKGVRAKAVVTLLRNNAAGNRPCGDFIAQEKGEVQFTETGISGICVFNLSRFIKVENGETIKNLPGKYSISIDLMPEYNREDVAKIIKKQMQSSKNHNEALLAIIDEKLIPVVLEKSERISDIAAIEEKIAAVLGDFRCSVIGVGGWKTAQVTAGGILVSEIDDVTMESKIVNNLFFAGEIIDYDGPCGGFNLHNAWMGGIKAGKAAVR